jgi:hypothetical protein
MDADRVPDLIATLVSMGAKVYEVHSGRSSLERRFLDLVARDRRPPAPQRAAPPMITIARLTIGEAARRRVLWVLVALALIAVALTTWGVSALIDRRARWGSERPRHQVRGVPDPDLHRVHVRVRAGDDRGVLRLAGDRHGPRIGRRPGHARPAAEAIVVPAGPLARARGS